MVATLQVIDATGKVVFERRRSPELLDAQRTIRHGEDEAAVFSRAQWDKAASFIRTFDLPDVLQHPPELDDIRDRLTAALNGGTAGRQDPRGRGPCVRRRHLTGRVAARGPPGRPPV